MEHSYKKILTWVLIVSIITSMIFGSAMGLIIGVVVTRNSNIVNKIPIVGWLENKVFKSGSGADNNVANNNQKIVKVDEESAVVSVAEKVAPAVVNIVATKDLPKVQQYYSDPFSNNDFFQQFFGDGFGNFFNTPSPAPKSNNNSGTEKKEISSGTGFIISSDGYIVTNKHVVVDEEAEYTVLTNDEKKYSAKVLARDPANDLAVLKIEAKDLPTVELGDSGHLKVGQSVIAIGNALGEFKNTVSTGVVSGLLRSITAGGIGMGSEQLTGVIQTDASINPGNSGGPLLNIAGQVIGINTAIAQGAQGIGFAIPINEVKNTIESVKKNGRIIRTWLGIRYAQINEAIAKANNLNINYGVLIIRGDKPTDLAVVPGGPADKAGLEENDIILEVNGQKIDDKNSLIKTLAQFKPDDEITLKIMHKGTEKSVKVRLGEMK